MPTVFQPILDQVRPSTLLDVAITALLIYWLFSLIRGTRAVRLVIGVTVLFALYAVAVWLDLRLVTQILQTGAIVGIFAFVVVFQPELRRGLERIGRVGSLAWLISPTDQRAAEHVAQIVARSASDLSHHGHGALMVLERETGLGEIAESGVELNAVLTPELIETIFMPRSPLHDGAVIIRGELIVAAGALLPLAETSLQSERFGTRHRAALGITEQTDAVVVVVSEENAQVSLVERARIVRNLSEPQLARALTALLNPAAARRTLFGLARAGAERRGDRKRPVARPPERPRSGEQPAGERAASDEDRSAAASARAGR